MSDTTDKILEEVKICADDYMREAIDQIVEDGHKVGYRSWAISSTGLKNIYAMRFYIDKLEDK